MKSFLDMTEFSVRRYTHSCFFLGLPRKPGMTRDDLFNKNAGVVADIAKVCASACPAARCLIISNPVNAMVPIFAEILKKVKHIICIYTCCTHLAPPLRMGIIHLLEQLYSKLLDILPKCRIPCLLRVA